MLHVPLVQIWIVWTLTIYKIYNNILDISFLFWINHNFKISFYPFHDLRGYFSRWIVCLWVSKDYSKINLSSQQKKIKNDSIWFWMQLVHFTFKSRKFQNRVGNPKITPKRIRKISLFKNFKRIFNFELIIRPDFWTKWWEFQENCTFLWKFW